MNDHPCSCETCDRRAEECLSKYNSAIRRMGCISHTNAISHFLPTIPTGVIVGELVTREGVRLLEAVNPGFEYSVLIREMSTVKDPISLKEQIGPAKILVVRD